MKNSKLLFIFGLFLCSCTSNTIYEKPKNIIPKDTMIDLYVESFIAVTAKHRKNKNLQKDINYFPLLYDKYKIDSTRFRESEIYYFSKIETYLEMMKQVYEKVDKLQKETEKLQKQADSLQKEDFINSENLDK